MTATLQHDAFVYDSEAAFIEELLPFAAAGVARGEAVYVVSRPGNCALLRDALEDQADPVEYVDAREWYGTPARTIAAYDRIIERARSNGAPGVRVVGEVEFGSTETDHAEWTRYEYLLNEAFRDRAAWIVCPYDARMLPEHVVRGAHETHPHAIEHGKRHASRSFGGATSFASALRLPPRGTEVGAVVLDGDLRPVRALTVRAVESIGLPRERADEICFAVNEIATNALVHGGPPVRVRAWTDGDEVVCEISDGGPGLPNPVAGFLPPRGPAASGLWLARQLSDRLEIVPGDRGTTVRLSVRA